MGVNAPPNCIMTILRDIIAVVEEELAIETEDSIDSD